MKTGIATTCLNRIHRVAEFTEKACLSGRWRVFAPSTVESHHPFPEHQQVSSGVVFRRSERTLLVRPLRKASASFFAVSSSRPPMHGMNIAGQTNRASNDQIIGTVKRSCGDLEQQVVLAGDPFEVRDQFAVDSHRCAVRDAMDHIHKQVRKRIDQLASAQMAERGKKSHPDGLRMSPQLMHFFNRHAATIPLHDVGRKPIKQIKRKLHVPQTREPV